MIVSTSSLDFTDAEWARLQAIARQRGLSESALLREAVTRTLAEAGASDGTGTADGTGASDGTGGASPVHPDRAGPGRSPPRASRR